ncbi:beta-galactosidase 15-like [Euphorbia lathyris]|uniref:beta-galactosidase 15-like n=1 Tax=Euphorbia lathyris TaxID=212925 RepID=UPI00331358C2
MMGFSYSVIILLAICSIGFAFEVSYDGRAIKIDGERKLILSGSIHYSRSTLGMWPDLIRKSKEGGLNTIETYVFWNAHEPERRKYDFSGNKNLVKFIKTIKHEGLYSILRIGPYVCAEWTYGGFPVWLHNLPGIQFRTNNEVYKKEMQTFTTLIVDMMKREKLFASQGGPIILAQIENEYGNVEWAYGDGGSQYVKWCANMAESFKVGVPWIMCQQNNAPAPMISACNGYYCDQWYPKSNSTPKVWTENWGGWFQNWGDRNPHRAAEDIAFAVARFIQLKGTVHNYYMYHGGTNFGNTGGGPYITTSYDYDAPLDEFGNLRQPKWGHLKNLHEVLKSMEKIITYGDVNTTDYHDSKTVSIYSHNGKRICFFSNIDAQKDKTLTFEGKDYIIPAWSVTILDDCKTEVYSTAKVNAQTAIMENKIEDWNGKLEWESRPEKALHINPSTGLIKGSTLATNQLLDQKVATNGTSDYLWLLTNYYHNTSDPNWCKDDNYMVLHVQTKGHVIHAFVNGKYAGSQWARGGNYEFVFEREIKLHQGENRISIVSSTVGLHNYGPHFENIDTGIHGPIQIISRSKSGFPDVVKDISSSRWVYKTGLHGEDLGLPQVDPHHHLYFYFGRNNNCNRPFIWYKTTFKTPSGKDPVVVDLIGMGKGTAWVNGKSIGRYWPKAIAPGSGCGHCDYRGTYGPSKCATGCGKPTQRYYHIPRDWLNEKANNLVLFEELGGNPQNITFQTVTVGKVCGNAYQGKVLELSCQGGKTFSDITFASFGSPNGACGSFTQGNCHVDALPIVQKACLGKEKCSLLVSKDSFGALSCQSDTYRLAVEAVC